MVDRLITSVPPPNAPGIYGIISAAGPTIGISGVGIVALVARASFGPVGEALNLGSPWAVEQTYGRASAMGREDLLLTTTPISTMANLAREAALGGAIGFVCARVGGEQSGVPGSRATLATGVFDNTGAEPPGIPVAGVQIGTVEAASEGTFGNTLRVSIRFAAGSTTVKEMVVFAGTVIVQQNRFLAGIAAHPSGPDEPSRLAAATENAQFARFLTNAAAPGSGVLMQFSEQPLSLGTDPEPSDDDYADAFVNLSVFPWATLITDSEDMNVFAAASYFVDTETQWGRFRTLSVGEPTSGGVPIQQRMANASSLNSALVRYQGTGFMFPNGDGSQRLVEGYLAAAVDGGILSTMTPGTSMTWRAIPGATALVTGPGGFDEASVINAGMGYYKYSRTLGIRTGAGVSTLTAWENPPIWALALNPGWRYLEHVATAFGLINSIGAEWEGMVANPNPLLRPPNTPAGRASLVAVANSAADRYRDLSWIASGEVIEDPSHPPSGNTAYFTFRNLVVALRTERIVLSLPFGTP